MTAAMVGVQRPRICVVPPAVTSTGDEAVELCRMAGLELDPWQEFTLASSLGERADGKWAAFEVGLTVSRQNGKGGIIEGRELTGLFLVGERLITHTAHQLDTSFEAFRRLLERIESCPDLDRRVKRVSRSHGEEGIELKGGQRIRFRTRTRGGGRGFSGDLVVFDEDMYLPVATIGALMPTLSASPNPQLWYTGTAVDQTIHEDGVVKARIRERALRGGDPRLAYFEWSADVELDDLDEERATDTDLWAAANPALGIRISDEYVADEQRSMDARTFAVERLSIGDWPDTTRDDGSVISVSEWNALTDPLSVIDGDVSFVFDVSPDRAWATISAAGLREDGLMHVEVVDRRRGTSWLARRLLELRERHDPAAVGCAGASPAASLIPQLEAIGVAVDEVSEKDHAKACGQLVDLVADEGIRHLGTPELRAALKGARRRPLGDAFAWSRRNSAIDISPLVGCTLAAWLAAGATSEPWGGSW